MDKCVIILDQELPLGLIANSAAILGCSLGKYVQTIIGEDTIDSDNFTHKGIINTPLPILSLSRDKLKELYIKIRKDFNDKVTLIDFNNIAQLCKNYDDYTEKLSNINSEELNYLGICIYGNKKIINSLTSSIPTLK